MAHRGLEFVKNLSTFRNMQSALWKQNCKSKIFKIFKYFPQSTLWKQNCRREICKGFKCFLQSIIRIAEVELWKGNMYISKALTTIRHPQYALWKGICSGTLAKIPLWNTCCEKLINLIFWNPDT